jgi:hypothetical protein
MGHKTQSCKTILFGYHSMASSIEGYDVSQILETLINTLVQKNVLSENEANYIKQSGQRATFRQSQAGYEQTGQAEA